jgi:hypothetical protein
LVDNSVDNSRIGVRLNLTAAAQKAIDGVKGEFGVVKQEALSRILEFYEALPRSVKKEIFDKAGDPIGELVRLRMAEMAAAGQGIDATAGMSHEDALRTIRMLLDQAERIHGAFKREVEGTRKRKGS